MTHPDPFAPHPTIDGATSSTNGDSHTTNGDSHTNNGTAPSTNDAPATAPTQYGYEYYEMNIIVVDFQNNRIHRLQITGEETVEMLASMIEDVSGVAPETQNLEFCTVRLLPGYYLEDYYIQEADIIDLF